MRETIIKIENISKQYRLGVIGVGTLRGDLQSFWARLRKKEDPNLKIGAKAYNKNEKFTALNNINLEIKKGERVGIIGHNGAGKSTLLKLLSRVTAPSEGTIYLDGRVSSMLEIGTGFHRELTGRENIYLNGAVLGMARDEVSARIDEIIEFSECGQFIDTPVKRYSSGMYVKLAFAVAAHLNNEILIMDEVLAVGDMAFQQKCIDKMNELSQDEGRTILYVSHNMQTIRKLCERCIVLDRGEVVFDGDVEEAISIYLNHGEREISLTTNLDELKRPKALIQKVCMQKLNLLNTENGILKSGEPLSFSLDWKSMENLSDVRFRMIMHYSDNTPIGLTISKPIELMEKNKDYSFTLSFDTSLLPKGDYVFSISLCQIDQNGSCIFYDHIDRAFHIKITDELNDDNPLIWHHRHWGSIKLPQINIIK